MNHSNQLVGGTRKRQYYLDVARVAAILSITLNHAVNRTYDNYSNQMKEFLSIGFGSTVLKAVISVFSASAYRCF